MAGVIAKRLRLTTSRKPSYRRGGVKIGTVSAPTYIEPGEVEPEQALAIVRDPNIVLAFEDEDGGVLPLTEEERAEIEDGILAWIKMRKLADPEPSAPAAGSEPYTAEPQGAGSVPEGGNADAEASKVAGADASANASDGSAADAGTSEPEQPAAAAPAPSEIAPAPAAPASMGASKPKKVKAKP